MMSPKRAMSSRDASRAANDATSAAAATAASRVARRCSAYRRSTRRASWRSAPFLTLEGMSHYIAAPFTSYTLPFTTQFTPSDSLQGGAAHARSPTTCTTTIASHTHRALHHATLNPVGGVASRFPVACRLSLPAVRHSRRGRPLCCRSRQRVQITAASTAV